MRENQDSLLLFQRVEFMQDLKGDKTTIFSELGFFLGRLLRQFEDFKYSEKVQVLRNYSTGIHLIHSWNSATLYSKEAIDLSKKHLYKSLEANKLSTKSILRLHSNNGEHSKKTKLRIETTESHQTVSITQLHSRKLDRRMNHVNFVSKQKCNFSF